MTVNSSDPFSGIAVSFFICSLYFLPLKVPKVKRPLSSRSPLSFEGFPLVLRDAVIVDVE